MGMGMKIGCLTWICQEVGIYVSGEMVHIMGKSKGVNRNPPTFPPLEIRDAEAHHHPPIRPNRPYLLGVRGIGRGYPKLPMMKCNLLF